MKKAIFLLIVLLTTLSLVNAQSFNSKMEVKRIYVGALYTGAYSAIYEHNNELNPRIGSIVNFQLPLGQLCTKIFFTDFGKSGSHFYWQKNIFYFLQLRAGHIPFATGFLMRGNPVSPDGHFEPYAFGNIQGIGEGALVKINLSKTSNLLGGCHYTGKNNFNLNLGLKQKLSYSALQKISVAGYISCNNGKTGKIRGLALKAEGSKYTTTAFAGQNIFGDDIYSLFTNLNLPWFNLYFDATHKNKCELAEIGITKLFPISNGFNCEYVNGLIGLGYAFSDYGPNVLKTYLQFYFDYE